MLVGPCRGKGGVTLLPLRRSDDLTIHSFTTSKDSLLVIVQAVSCGLPAADYHLSGARPIGSISLSPSK